MSTDPHYPFPESEPVPQTEQPKPLIIVDNGVRRSKTIGKLVEALCKAQLEFAPVVKSNINPQFKSKYADLATIIQATMPALAKNGLAIIQTPYVDGRLLTMTTMLVHSSDEWISNELTMPATMRNELTAQTIGSACTYSRRYALQSILGVSADVDDDATEASGGGTAEAAQRIATEKIADHRKKTNAPAPDTNDITKMLFYTWDNDEQKAYITGAKELLENNRELLLAKCTWDAKLKTLKATDTGIEDLKYELGQRGVPFKALNTAVGK